MRIRVNAIHIKYELSGRPGAPVVMLSHALGVNRAMWNPQLPALEPHFRVLRYDTRGHGGSDAPEGPYSLEMLAADAVALLDALTIDAVHWVGLSMGGMIGQQMALEHADRLRSLALSSTAAALPPDVDPLFEERIAVAAGEGMRPLLQPTLERWFTQAYLRRNSPGVELIRDRFVRTPAAGYIGCTHAIRKLNLLDRLHGIDLPTLVVVGENDLGTPVAAAQAIAAAIPDARLAIISQAAHLCNIEQSARFNDLLLEHLREYGF
jgi:3-oxoadipate enol-lactonase